MGVVAVVVDGVRNAFFLFMTMYFIRIILNIIGDQTWHKVNPFNCHLDVSFGNGSGTFIFLIAILRKMKELQCGIKSHVNLFRKSII